MADPRIAKVKAARTAAIAAEEDAIALFNSTFPVSSSLSWEYMNSIQHGVVTQHGYGDRLKVRNQNTGREYWISHYHVYQAYP